MDSKGFWGAVTLVLFGVIIADLVTHADQTKTALQGFDSVLRTSYSGMLGGATVQ